MDVGAGRTLSVRIPAKINLHLGVGPRRRDGYHEVVTVLQTVSIFDTLRLQLVGDMNSRHPSEPRRMHVVLTVDEHGHTDGIPADARNLALVAASRFMRHLGMLGDGVDDVDGGVARGGGEGSGPHENVEAGGSGSEPPVPTTFMHLTKRIPVAAGMAGGSADAAAALVGLNRLWEADLDAETLGSLAADVGSDVPFCIIGGSALATGTGTSVARVLTRGTLTWVVGIDRAPLSTADVYAEFDRLEPPVTTSHDDVLQALRSGDLDALAAALHNDLEPAAVALRPILSRRREAMLQAGALATLVSGSGPTMLALARDATDARRLAAEVEPYFDAVEVATSPANGPELMTGRLG